MHDTTPSLFHSFLRFVYSGKLDDSDMDSSDSLSELLLLADRYEMDSLKELCEGELVGRVDFESALTLISIADHFNASKLKVIYENFFLRKQPTNFRNFPGELCRVHHSEQGTLADKDVSGTFGGASEGAEGFGIVGPADSRIRRGQAAAPWHVGSQRHDRPYEAQDRCEWGRYLEDSSLFYRTLTSLQFDAEGEEIETIPLTHDSNQLETCVNQGRYQMMLFSAIIS